MSNLVQYRFGLHAAQASKTVSPAALQDHIQGIDDQLYVFSFVPTESGLEALLKDPHAFIKEQTGWDIPFGYGPAGTQVPLSMTFQYGLSPDELFYLQGYEDTGLITVTCPSLGIMNNTYGEKPGLNKIVMEPSVYVQSCRLDKPNLGYSHIEPVAVDKSITVEQITAKILMNPMQLVPWFNDPKKADPAPKVIVAPDGVIEDPMGPMQYVLVSDQAYSYTVHSFTTVTEVTEKGIVREVATPIEYQCIKSTGTYNPDGTGGNTNNLNSTQQAMWRYVPPPPPGE